MSDENQQTPREITLGWQPHLVVVKGSAYCYTCDEDVPARRDGRCFREVKAQENAARRAREKEARRWPTH